MAGQIGRRGVLGGGAAWGASFALRAGVAARPPAGEFRFVAGRLRAPIQLSVVRTEQTYSAHKVAFISPEYVTNRFRVAYAGHVFDPQLPGEMDMPDAYAIEGISLQALIDGRWQVVRGTFAGQEAVQVSPGVGVLSDDIVFPAAVPANTPMASVVAIRASAGQRVPVNSRARVGTDEGAVGDGWQSRRFLLDVGGAWEGPDGRFSGRLVTPTYIVGVGGDRPVFWVDGDSIGYGKNGNENELTGARFHDGTGALGYIAMALEERRRSRRMAFGMTCVPGVRFAERAVRANWGRQLDLLRLVPNRPYTHIISQHGNSGPQGGYENAFVPAIARYYELVQAESAAWGDGPAPIYQTRSIARPGAWPTSLAAQTRAGAQPGYAARWAFDADLAGERFAALAGCIPTNTYYGYDQGDHWDKIAVPTFSAVVTRPCAAGEREVLLSAAPVVGTFLLFGPGQENLGAHVVSVTDGFPVRVLLEQGFDRAIAAGLPVQAVLAADGAGVHPATAGHERIAAAMVDWKVTAFGH